MEKQIRILREMYMSARYKILEKAILEDCRESTCYIGEERLEEIENSISYHARTLSSIEVEKVGKAE